MVFFLHRVMKIQPALTKLVVFASIVLNTTPRTQAIPPHHGSRHKAHHNNTTTHTGSHTRAAPASTCPTDGFSPSAASCMCNFAGACDISTDTPTSAAASSPRTLTGFAPQNVEGFAYDKGGATSVGTLCEKGTVAVLYDCNGRVPLYAATVLDGGKAGGMLKRPWNYILRHVFFALLYAKIVKKESIIYHHRVRTYASIVLA